MIKSPFFKLILLFSFFISPFLLKSQNVGINTTTPDASAALDIKSTTSGVLVPRMTTTQRTAISTPAIGLLVFDTDLGQFYFYSSTAWTAIPLSTSSGVGYVGTSYLGKTSGAGSTGTSEGTSSNLYNIAIGANALNANTTANNNIALGQNALKANTTASNNIALGQNALQSVNGFAYYYQFPDIAIGYNTLKSSNYAGGNIAIGYQSQQATNGDGNTTGVSNTSLGAFTLRANTEGNGNVAVGSSSLQNNSTGNNNTGLGVNALSNNTTGYENTAVGLGAGTTSIFNSTVANTTGYSNTFLGVYAGAGSSDLHFATAIGYAAKVNTSNSMVLGGTGTYAVNVGIGTASPSQTLDVVGTTKTTNFQMTNGATNGYLLQSDASGNGTWVNSLTFSNGNWTTSGTNQYSALSGNIGIGTSTPSDKLHVVGNGRMDAGRLTFVNTGRSVYIGENTGTSDNFASTNANTGVGYRALEYNTTGKGNTAIGELTLTNTTTGKNNSAVGGWALFNNTTGIENTATGYNALESNTTGSYNTAYGLSALDNSATGNDNTAIGRYSLYSLDGGSSNTVLGLQAGYSNLTGSSNVFLGYKAGYSELGSNKLYIANSTTSSPLIWGDFSNNYLNFNAKVGIGTTSPSYALDIQNSSTVIANVQSSASSAYLSSTSLAANESAVKFNTYVSSSSAPSRWIMGKGSSGESGSNSGSDFFINRYSDAGVYNGQPLSINRQNGTVTVGNDGVSTTSNTLRVNGSLSVATTAIVSLTGGNTKTLGGSDYCLVYGGSSSGNAVVLPTASTCSGRMYLLVNHSTSSISISTYYTGSSTTSTTIVVDSTVQLISDGIAWHKIN